MRRRQSWDRTRSTHADVLASLEGVIARHPANGSRVADGVTALHDPTRGEIEAPLSSEAVRLPTNSDAAGATVLAFRPRLRLAPALTPDGAA